MKKNLLEYDLEGLADFCQSLGEKRFRATQQVGHLKAEHEMPASDPSREEQQVARLRTCLEPTDRAASARKG